MSEPSLPGLEAERDRTFALLASQGDFRRGSVSEDYRRCGKPNCACGAPDHRGHGPGFQWTRTSWDRPQGTRSSGGLPCPGRVWLRAWMRLGAEPGSQPLSLRCLGGRDGGQQVGQVAKQRHAGEQAHGQRRAVVLAADGCGARDCSTDDGGEAESGG